MVKTPLQGAQAGTLIGELRSHKPTSVAKQKKGFFPSSLGFLVDLLRRTQSKKLLLEHEENKFWLGHTNKLYPSR